MAKHPDSKRTASAKLRTIQLRENRRNKTKYNNLVTGLDKTPRPVLK